jgi:hypothetical protein
MDLEKDEVIDFAGEDFKRRSIPCSVSLLILLIVALINIFMMFFFPSTYISTYVSIAVLFVFVLYYSYVLAKNPGRIRKFSISHKEIVVQLPSTSTFIIYWSEFKQIEIRKIEFNYKPYNRYEFHFINNDIDKSFELSLNDFHKAKINNILVLTKIYAKKMNKEFRSVKETNVSGVILLEDFKI